MADRDVSIDILATDKTGRATKSATRNFEDLKKKVSKATDSVSDSLGSGLVKKLKPIGAMLIKPLVAGIAAGAPAIAAAVTSAFALGAGGGLLLFGYKALQTNEKIKKQFEDLGNDVKKVFADAAKPLHGPFVRAFKDVRKIAQDLSPHLSAMFKVLAPVIPMLTKAFGGVFKEVVLALRDSMPGIMAAFKGLAGALPTVGKWIGRFIRTLLGNPAVIENTTKALTLLAAGPLKLLGPLLSGLNVLFGVQVNLMRLFQLSGGKLWSSLVQWLDGGTGAVGRLKAAWGPLWDAIQNVWNKLKEFAGAKTDQEIVRKFGELVQSIKDAWGPLKTFLGTVWAEAWAFVKRKWNDTVVPWWNGTAKPWLEKQLAGAMDRIFKMAVDKAVGWLKSLPGKAWNAVKGLPGDLLRALGGAMAAAGSSIGRGFVNSLIGAIRGRIGDVRTAGRAAGSAAAAGARAVFSSGGTWQPAQVAAQFAGGGSLAMAGSGVSRTGGPVRVESTIHQTVVLDGKVIDQRIERAIERYDRQRKVGRR